MLALGVSAKGAPLCSSVPTPRNVAGEALPRMGAHVSPEMATLRRSIPTPNGCDPTTCGSQLASLMPVSASARASEPLPLPLPVLSGSHYY